MDMAEFAGIRPIHVIAGGIVPADELIGRERELARLLQLSAPPAHGAVLLGDRRIGKTSLLGAVEEPLRAAGHLVVRVSAETDSLDKFGQDLLKGLRADPRKGLWDIQMEGEAAVNVGLAKFTLRGKTQRGSKQVEDDLFAACARAARRSGSQHRVIFLLDEITVLASELAKRSQDEAREFLRTLRRARQELPEVGMFLAGSIGLHHALTDQTVVNDLTRIHVDVLAPEDATTLALGLIKGAELPLRDPSAVAAEMVAQSSGFPYFLHGIADLLSQCGRQVTPQDVRSVFQAALDQNSWSTKRYDERLDGYYGPEAELVRAILDTVALSGGAVGLAALEEAAAVAKFQPVRTQLINLLDRLEADHYLRRSGNASQMASGLITRIWCHVRRLG
jgi:hypothetical protein